MLKSILAIVGAAVLMVAIPTAGILVGIVIAIMVLYDLQKQEKEEDKKD